MTKKEIRKIFNDLGIQISESAIELILVKFRTQVSNFARNSLEWELKRVKPENIEKVYWRKVDWLNKVADNLSR